VPSPISTNNKVYLILDQNAARGAVSPVSWGDNFNPYPDTWTAITTPVPLRVGMRYPFAMVWGDDPIQVNFFWGIDQLNPTQNIYRSQDNGASWVTIPVPAGSSRKWNQITQIRNATMAGDISRFIAVGEAVDGNNVMYSDDQGSSWTLVTGVAGAWTDVTWIPSSGGTVYIVAVGPGGIMYSSDRGITWNSVAVPAGWNPVNPRITNISNVLGASFPTLMAIGGDTDNPSDLIQCSDDVTDWTVNTIPVIGSGCIWKAVAGHFDGFGGYYAMVVGNKGIITQRPSTAGGIWQSVELCEYPYPPIL